MSSLASNELFYLSKSSILITFIFPLLLLMAAPFKMENSTQTSNMCTFYSTKDWLNLMYSSASYQLTMFLVVYLLVTMIIIAFNLKMSSSPLRSQL